PRSPSLHYLVMELIDGGDVENYVIEHGPLPITQACDMIRQAACGLQEAHDHHLIHRDIKPSNLLLTKEGQVKLVDFGLVRQFHSQLTDPSCLLGSLEFMSPEQSIDPSAVDGRADIYGLGATLFWMLTGQTPYPEDKSIARALRRLQCERPRHLREFRPEAPAELDALLDRMMEHDPAQRPALPAAVMNALTHFAASAGPVYETFDPKTSEAGSTGQAPATAESHTWHVLIADDDRATRASIRNMLEPIGCVCGEAENAETAWEAIHSEPY